MNIVILKGNVGHSPEVKALESGDKVATLSIATNKSWKNKAGEKVTDTQWHNLVAWGPKAEVIEKYVGKGSQILIRGELRHRSYEGKDGNTRYITEIYINDLEMLDKKSDGAGTPPPPPGENNQNNASAQTQTAGEPEPEDDLPF